MYSNWAVGFKMIVIMYIALATCLSYNHANEIFPEALVFEGLGLSDIINNTKSSENRNNTIIIAGDLNDALTTMNFHRKNINDYLCRQYIVEEILKDITDSTSFEGRSMSLDSRGTSKTSLMQTDQGSSAYNAWLIKTKLLKRIYDEYDLNVRMREKPVGFTLTNKNNESLGTRDYETMKNVDEVKDLKNSYHPNEDSFSSPSDTVSVDFTQSQSVEYDIDDDKKYKKPNQTYHGLPDFNPTQSTHLPPSAYEPSFPLSTHGLPLLPANYGPSTFLNETPSYPSDYEMPPLSSYGLPPSSHHKLPPSSHESPPSSSYGSPASSNGHSFLPQLNYRSQNYPYPGLIPPTENPGPDLTTRNIKTFSQLEDEVHTFDKEPRRGLTATDMYDLTLTAIAFLGFGTFIMNLVMDAMTLKFLLIISGTIGRNAYDKFITITRCHSVQN
ncbi:uncharacterized protein LOC112602627 isoform X2 [Melanaphis sacchari]|uniref:uncharacterized protein LOC112602627 isoform X2 n=1 Tax=Melanaphis sacchari TaxID=742174 RepID=UPI000DC12E7F|nr:uncharacterized protein LOC112602627 isoform X2 [Melanaphis sacchari]